MKVDATFSLAANLGAVGDAEVSEVGGIPFVDTHSCLVSATYFRQTIPECDSEAFSTDTN